MRNASSHQCKEKMSGSEKKVNKKTSDISSIKHVAKKFLEASHCDRAIITKAKKCTKKVCCTCKVVFC